MRWLAVLLLGALPALAEGDHRAGEFDYYVLSLSWSPTWCALEGDGRDAPECREEAALGWVLHGLWPQYEEGWPSYCRTSHRDPSRSETAAMADIEKLEWFYALRIKSGEDAIAFICKVNATMGKLNA